MARTADLILDVLAKMPEWRVASTLWAPEAESVSDEAGAAWRTANTHAHDGYEEILIPLAGEGCYGAFGSVLECRPGVLLFFARGEVHDNGYPRVLERMEHLWISVVHRHYVARRVRIGTGGLGFRPLEGITLAQTDSEACLDRCWAALREHPEIPRPIARARLVSAVALLLCRLAETLLSGKPSGRQSSQEEVVAAIQQHLRRTAGRGDTLDTLARIAGYSKYHFLRLFKRVTGVSVHAFIDECRVEKTEELFTEGWSKKEIAFELGFSCPSAFSRWERNCGLRE